MAGLSYSLSRYGSASTSTCPPPCRAPCQAGRASCKHLTLTARGPAGRAGGGARTPFLFWTRRAKQVGSGASPALTFAVKAPHPVPPLEVVTSAIAGAARAQVCSWRPVHQMGSHGAVTAGAVAGFVEAVAVHPLDMIKTRCLSLWARLRATGALRRAADVRRSPSREFRCATRVPAAGFRV